MVLTNGGLKDKVKHLGQRLELLDKALYQERAKNARLINTLEQANAENLLRQERARRLETTVAGLQGAMAASHADESALALNLQHIMREPDEKAYLDTPVPAAVVRLLDGVRDPGDTGSGG